MVLLKNIITELECFAPPYFQEDYDNSGLQTGNPDMEITGILVTLDVTEEVIDEALSNQENLIVSHHPVTLKGIKSLTGRTHSERILIKAIRHNIAIYSAHTNIDSVEGGVSGILAKKLGLTNIRILKAREGLLLKLVTFAPLDYADKVRKAIFLAGAGVIGKYDSCSFSIYGTGSFKAGIDTKPFVGKKGKIHYEREERIETIVPVHLKNKVLEALHKAHPYEEVAFDFYPLHNKWNRVGFGAIGEMPKPLSEKAMLDHIKKITASGCVRHTKLLNKPVQKVAVCGGSGSFLLNTAMTAKADIIISADFKYHQFQEADNKIVIADIGHYESEQFTKDVFFELLTKKFPNFAVRLSKVSTNPIKYY